VVDYSMKERQNWRFDANDNYVEDLTGFEEDESWNDTDEEI